MTLQQEFLTAKALDSADELLFQPILEKYEELKKVIDSNFLCKDYTRNWYGKKVWFARPVLTVTLEYKISNLTGKYLLIRINGNAFIMSIGQLGELKDKLYFCTGTMYSKDKTIIHIISTRFGTFDFCLEDNITCVQLFSDMIKRYKTYLKGN